MDKDTVKAMTSLMVKNSVEWEKIIKAVEEWIDEQGFDDLLKYVNDHRKKPVDTNELAFESAVISYCVCKAVEEIWEREKFLEDFKND